MQLKQLAKIVIVLLLTGNSTATYADAPTNENALCIYNSNSPDSMEICGYYISKRPGAHSFGINIPDSAFQSWQRATKESINGPEFLSYILRPVYEHVYSHPELKITHLAIAKGVPITVYDQAQKKRFGNNGLCILGGCSEIEQRKIIASASMLFAYEGDWRRAGTLEDYVFDNSKFVFETDPARNNFVFPKLKPGMQFRNLGYENSTLAVHFNPDDYKDDKYALKPRFAVSHLTGFKVDDIKKMIDKAQSPPPNISSSYFAFPIKSDNISLVEWAMRSAGAQKESLAGASDSSNPVSFSKPLVAYSSWGVHQGYHFKWIAGAPMVRSAVANRAVFNSIESWNAATMSGSPEGERDGAQGLIADAISQNTFGGTNYSDSFSAAFGNVYEPTTIGIVDSTKFFANYAAGLTVGESLLRSAKLYEDFSLNILIGDPLMRITDAPLVEKRIEYKHEGCVMQDLSKLDPGRWICIDSFTRQQCLLNKSEMGNEVKCKEGCFQGHCGEEYQIIPPSTVRFNNNGNSHSVSLPFSVTNKTIPEVFINAPEGTQLSIYNNQRFVTVTYDGGEWLLEQHIPEMPKISSGDGLLVKVPIGTNDIELTGDPILSSPEIYLSGGFNFVGLPFCGKSYTASQVLDELSNKGANCDLIHNSAKPPITWPPAFWSNNNSVSFQGYKIDFPLNNKEAYWIRCQSGTTFTWKPSCGPQMQNNKPAVSISKPPNNSKFEEPATISLEANAYDQDGTISKVEFYSNGTVIGTKTAAPYALSLSNLNAGVYNYSAKAYDDKLLAAESEKINVTVSKANQTPTVTLLSPTDNSTITAPANITVTASATDPDGIITKVEFFEMATKIGEATTQPYTYTWNGTPIGQHSITAKATDNSNAQTISKAITFTVNQPPLVSITSPTEGATLPAPANITIAANSSDSDGKITKVEFYQGSTKIGEDLASPYTVQWNNVSSGTYSLTAKAYDDKGASKTSSSVNINLGTQNQTPQVSITSPANNSIYQMPATINIVALASDSDGTIAKVQFYSNGSKIGEDSSQPFEFAWQPNYAGAYYLTAMATDNKDATKTSESVAVTVLQKATPKVSLSLQTEGKLREPADVTVRYEISSPGAPISKVTIFKDQTKQSEYGYAISKLNFQGLTKGAHTFTATVTDIGGLSANSAPLIVNVFGKNQSPAIFINQPRNGEKFTEGSEVIIDASANDVDGNLTIVSFYDGEKFISADYSAPFSIKWKPAMGEHKIKAKAIDDEKAESFSNEVAITIEKPTQDTTPPSLTIISPTENFEIQENSEIQIKVAVGDEQGEVSKIEYYADGKKMGESSTAPYDFTLKDLNSGSHSIIIKAYDFAGFVTQKSVSVNVRQKPQEPQETEKAEINSVRLAWPSQDSAEVHFAFLHYIGGKGDFIATISILKDGAEKFKSEVIIAGMASGSAVEMAFPDRWNAPEAGDYQAKIKVLSPDKAKEYAVAGATINVPKDRKAQLAKPPEGTPIESSSPGPDFSGILLIAGAGVLGAFVLGLVVLAAIIVSKSNGQQ